MQDLTRFDNRIIGNLILLQGACQPPPSAAISATLLTHCVVASVSKLCCALRLLFSVVALKAFTKTQIEMQFLDSLFSLAFVLATFGAGPGVADLGWREHLQVGASAARSRSCGPRRAAAGR